MNSSENNNQNSDENAVLETVQEATEENKEEVKEEQNTTSIEMKNNKKSKKKIIIGIVVVLVLIIGIGGYFAYDKFFANNKDKKIETKENKEEKEDKEKNKNDKKNKDDILANYEGLELIEEKYENELAIYKEEDYNSFYDTKYDWNKLYKKVKVETKTAKLIHSLEDKYFIINDNGLKLYDNKNEKIYKIKEKFRNVSVEINTKDDIFVGFVYRPDYNEKYEKYGYYDAVTNERKFESKNLDDISVVREGYISYTKTRYIDDEESRMDSYLMEISTGKEVIKTEDSACSYFDIEEINGKKVIFEGLSCSGGELYNVYDSNYRKFLTEINDSYLSWDKKEILYLNKDNNILYTLDANGKEKSKKELDSDLKIYQLIRNYVTYVKDDKLYIYDYNKKEEIYLNDWDENNYFYHSMLSGYYEKNQLANENEKEAGIYIVISLDEGDDEFGAGKEFYINPKTNKVTTYELEEVGGYAKPVLYLYPKKTTNITVKFENENMLTTTYPKFKNSWNVKAEPNGDLHDKDGKYYYGLYWEEKPNHNISFKEGFYVTGDNAIDFLEEKLSLIGLNDRERNEFIMYWLPILEKNGQSLVYFELTEERENYNKLEITPKPDSMLRMAIHVKKVNQKVNIKEQTLTKFNRTGFAAIEWGGVIHK